MVAEEITRLKESSVAQVYETLFVHSLLLSTLGVLRGRDIISPDDVQEIVDVSEKIVMDVGLSAVVDLGVNPNRAEVILNRVVDQIGTSLRSNLGR